MTSTTGSVYASDMTPEQRSGWRLALELKLRKCAGDAFQDFFSSVMSKAYGSDYIRLRAHGKLGDKGCDGYLDSSGRVFQCYGALNGDSGKVSYLIAKMDEDFAKAKAGVPELLKEWHMVHNLVDGLPIEAVQKLNELAKANPTIKFGFLGHEALEEIIFGLEHEKITDLLGAVATGDDAWNLNVKELRILVENIQTAAENAPYSPEDIKPVPPDKLDFNNLSPHWKRFISYGWQNAHLVGEYLNRHIDAMIGENIATVMNQRYQYLKSQHLSPDAIMAALYEVAAGVKAVTTQRHVAVQALLAYLFESCDIFEDHPSKVAS
jgi:hypothetical protein